jgi:tetratricopeptide (TPR) repeat protein
MTIHVRTASLLVCLLAGSALFSSSLRAETRREREKREKQEEEEVDYLALGARLIADGHYDRAISVLRELDPKDEKVDRAKLHILLGNAYLKQNLYAQARDELQASVRAGNADPSIHILIAHAQFQLGEFRACISSLNQAPQAAKENPGSFAMRAEAHWKLKEPSWAIKALDDGSKTFPGFSKLQQMKIGYLIELGLYQEVVRVGESYLARKDIQPSDFVAVAEGLRRSKQLGEARLIMERAQLRFPDDATVSLQLANIYSDLERPLSAAMLFEKVARSDPKYNFEAAELYKEAKRLARALSLNARILDPEKKLKQRLAILLDMERFELVAGMEPSLSRAGLLKDESIRYALAFGHYKNGAFDSAEQHLRQLSDSSLFEKATALRKAMATCREAGWACY